MLVVGGETEHLIEMSPIWSIVLELRVNSCAGTLTCQSGLMDCLISPFSWYNTGNIRTEGTFQNIKIPRTAAAATIISSSGFPLCSAQIIYNHQSSKISIGLHLLHTWDLTYNYESHTQYWIFYILLNISDQNYHL